PTSKYLATRLRDAMASRGKEKAQHIAQTGGPGLLRVGAGRFLQVSQVPAIPALTAKQSCHGCGIANVAPALKQTYVQPDAGLRLRTELLHVVEDAAASPP